MKKYILLIALTIFSLACAGGRSMEVTYTVASGASLNNATVYLEVVDDRPTKELVGVAAREKELFEELRGGRFDLTSDLPNGSKVTMTNLSVPEAVREAANRRLQAMGAIASSQREADRINVIVHIQRFVMDLQGGDLVANIDLSAEMYRDASRKATIRAGSQTSRMKVIGSSGGDKALSDALTQVMNDLDFSKVNQL